jgi:hypothetical protein
MNWQRNRAGALLLLLFCMCHDTFAHTINYQLEKAPVHNVIGYYALLGFKHIIPDGLDHILFVTGLCLLNTKWKTILWQATAFTVAHSITLALSMKGIMFLPPLVVEPLIALSIVFVAIENIILNELKPWRFLIVFLFGLIHGLGFASSLNEIGLPRDRFLTSILSFNLGVEAGQVFVILVVFGLLILPFKQKENYRRLVVYPLSAVIALIAGYWTIERML